MHYGICTYIAHLKIYTFIMQVKLKEKEAGIWRTAVIGSKQIVNHSTMIKCICCTRSDYQQTLFTENSGVAYVYQHMYYSTFWFSDHL